MTRLDRLSDSQANAEALARRTSTYADEHAASWQVRFDRPTHERVGLRDTVRRLRRAYRDEIPQRLHIPEVDEGGTPSFSPEFKQYLYGSPTAVDRHDERALDNAALPYLSPFRRCLQAMTRANEVDKRRAQVVTLIIAGSRPKDAACTVLHVDDACFAGVVAREAIATFYERMADMRMDLRPVDSEAPAA